MLVQQGQIPGLNKRARLVFNGAEMLFLYNRQIIFV